MPQHLTQIDANTHSQTMNGAWGFLLKNRGKQLNATHEKIIYLYLYLNLVLNYILVTRFGAIGAAIATTISYYVVWLTRLFFVKKYITLKINLLRDHLAYLMLLAQTFLILFFESTIWIYGLEVMIFIIIMIMYKDILLRGLEIIKVKLK